MTHAEPRLVQVGFVQSQTRCLWLSDPVHLVSGARRQANIDTEIARCAFQALDKPVQGNDPVRHTPDLGVALPLPSDGKFTVHEVYSKSGTMTGYFIALA